MRSDGRVVLYDFQIFSEQAHGGVSRYFSELATSVERGQGWHPLLFAGIHVADIPPVATVGLRLRIPSVPHTVRALRLLNRQLMAAFGPRLRTRSSVYHPTWYDLRTLDLLAGVPMVITIHDLIPEQWPEVTSPAQVAERATAIRRAQRIICISHATLARLAHFYPTAVEKATVIRLGLPRAYGSIGTAHKPRRPYLLYVGKRGSYKDFATLLRALPLAPTEVSVIAAGGGRPSADLLRRLEADGLEGRVSFEPAPTDQRLQDLLTGALALVSTSREEGFGLPALEALGAGIPAVLSDITVYRELYERWARFFPVGDAEALAGQIAELAHPPVGAPAARGELEASFSWDETARRTVEVYAAVVEA